MDEHLVQNNENSECLDYQDFIVLYITKNPYKYDVLLPYIIILYKMFDQMNY